MKCQNRLCGIQPIPSQHDNLKTISRIDHNILFFSFFSFFGFIQQRIYYTVANMTAAQASPVRLCDGVEPELHQLVTLISIPCCNNSVTPVDFLYPRCPLHIANFRSFCVVCFNATSFSSIATASTITIIIEKERSYP